LRAPHVKGLVIQIGLEVTAAQGDNDIRQEAHLETHESDFETCFPFRIAYEKIGCPKGEGIEGAARRNAIAAEAVSAQILDRGQGAWGKDF
jgi:hypothetical protein